MNDGKDCQNRGFILEDGNFCVKNLAAGSMRRIRYSEKRVDRGAFLLSYF